MATKRFFWLKLPKSFSSSLAVKALLRLPDGLQILAVYILLLLEAVDKDGGITWQHVCGDQIEELALLVGTDTDSMRRALEELERLALVECFPDQDAIFLPQAVEFTGSESDSAPRTRKYRANLKEGTKAQNGADSSQNVTPAHNVTAEKSKSKRRDKEDTERKKNLPAAPDRASDFSAFWAAYPRKVGKAAAEKAFLKVEAPLQTLLDAVEAQKRSPRWTRDGGQFIPYPATWLNQRRWEDEIAEATPPVELPGIVHA